MAPKPRTKEQLQESLDLYTQFGGSLYYAAQDSGIPPATIRDRKDEAIAKDMKPSEGLLLKPSPQLASSSKMIGADGSIRLQWIKEKEDKAQSEAKIFEMVEGFKATLPRLKRTPQDKKKSKEDLMNVVPIGDHHFGMLSWEPETGQDYDLDIAKHDLCAAFDYLISQAPPAEVTLIISLGDFFHTDSYEGTTQSGHILDMDSRLPKMVQVGVASMRQAITTSLTKSKTVEVICTLGNHDRVLSMALAVLLSHVYEKEPRVIIHDQPTWRHYRRWGKTLIGVTHGDKAGKKTADLPGIMATERPEDWGETEFRYFFRGHTHTEARTEYRGCITEVFRTLAGADSYTTAGGWISGRDLKLLTMSKQYGEVGRTTCSINLLRDLSK